MQFLLHATRVLLSEYHNAQESVARRAIADKHSTSAYYGKTTTIEVGLEENSRTLHIHRDLLSFYSGYFRHILNSGIVESSSDVIHICDVEPAAFEGFVKWLYTRKARDDNINEHNDYQHYMFFVKLWILAGCRNVPLWMNEMFDSLHQSVVTM